MSVVILVYYMTGHKQVCLNILYNSIRGYIRTINIIIVQHVPHIGCGLSIMRSLHSGSGYSLDPRPSDLIGRPGSQWHVTLATPHKLYLLSPMVIPLY